MKRPVDKETLFDFFEGKTSSIQLKMIEEWLLEPGNNDRYYQYLDEWESRHIQFLPDETKAIEKYRSVLTGNLPAPLDNKPVPRRKNWLGAKKFRVPMAAALLFALALFGWRDQILYYEYQNPFGKTKPFRLSDGTQVVLNADSRLCVPRFGFSEDARRVILDGEAEFEVTHTPNSSRFIVEMRDGYAVEVLGTRFVAFARNRTKRVFLVEGKVKMKLPEGRQLYMKPGNLFEVSSRKRVALTTPEKPQQYLAWKTHQFYFDNTPLPEVARQMEERFGVVIEIADSTLKEKKLGGIYEAQSPDDLLQILDELYNLDISQNNNRIELRSGSNL